MRRRWRRGLSYGGFGLLGVLACVGGLFVANGLWPSWRRPEAGPTGLPARRGPIVRVRVMAYNIAKCFASEGLSFRDAAEVRRCLDGIAALIRQQRADLVFLSEVHLECGPCGGPSQVTYLARRAGMHAWAFGDNYSFGLPFYRIRSGNAVLSRLPLRPLATEQLTGGAPFYRPVNNRRILWVDVDLGGGRSVRAAALRNDSFDLDNNLAQARQILARLAGRPALLAGDFNAPPGSASLRAFAASGLFAGQLAGPPTFPSEAPDRCIDYILAPRSWRLLSHQVIASELSDHRPVLSVFALP